MDAKFYPAIATLETGDVEKLKALIAADPSLATSRSTVSHPTLLQCFVLDGKDKPNARRPAGLIGRGAISAHGRRISRASSTTLLSTLACTATLTRRGCCWKKVRRST
jgi:hypothetical protein